jgi:hypothetical protein
MVSQSIHFPVAKYFSVSRNTLARKCQKLWGGHCRHMHSVWLLLARCNDNSKKCAGAAIIYRRPTSPASPAAACAPPKRNTRREGARTLCTVRTQGTHRSRHTFCVLWVMNSHNIYQKEGNLYPAFSEIQTEKSDFDTSVWLISK